MYTREAPDFWALHKNVNCAFPLKSVNSLCFCFQKCFQDLIVTFLIDSLYEAYCMISVLKISEKYYFTTRILRP